jgi:hypothetical protein
LIALGKAGRYWTKWRKLSFRAKISFVRAVFSLLWIKAGLSFLPFSSFRKLFHWLSTSRSSVDMTEKETEEIVWAVSTAADLLPLELLCLPRALSTKFLMRKASFITLEIGIEINPRKKFEAHAWVERNGKVIIGDWSNSVSYQRLWVWQ